MARYGGRAMLTNLSFLLHRHRLVRRNHRHYCAYWNLDETHVGELRAQAIVRTCPLDMNEIVRIHLKVSRREIVFDCWIRLNDVATFTQHVPVVDILVVLHTV